MVTESCQEASGKRDRRDSKYKAPRMEGRMAGEGSGKGWGWGLAGARPAGLCGPSLEPGPTSRAAKPKPVHCTLPAPSGGRGTTCSPFSAQERRTLNPGTQGVQSLPVCILSRLARQFQGKRFELECGLVPQTKRQESRGLR